MESYLALICILTVIYFDIKGCIYFTKTYLPVTGWFCNKTTVANTHTTPI